MPNWVRNKLKIKADAETLRLCKEIMTDSDGEVTFQKIAPIPKELNVQESSANEDYIIAFERSLGIPFKDEVYQRAIQRIRALPKGASESLDYLFDGGSDPKTQEDAIALGRILFNNMERYGCTSWYTWCISKWGTKWDASESYVQDITEPDGPGVEMSFETAWDPPLPIFERMAERLPHSQITFEYADENLGYHAGQGTVTESGVEITAINDFEFSCSVWGYDPEEMSE